MANREEVYRLLSNASVPDSIKRKLFTLYDLCSPAAFNYHVDRLTRFTEDFTRAHARPAELGNITNASFFQGGLPNLSMSQRWRDPGAMFPYVGGSVLNASVTSRARGRLQPDEYIRVKGVPEESDEMDLDDGNKENFDVRNRYEPAYRRTDPRMLSYTPDPPKTNHPDRLGARIVPQNSKGKKKARPVSEESEESSEDESPQKKPKEAPKKKRKTPEKPLKKKRNTPPKKSKGTPVDSSRKESQQKRATKQENGAASTSEQSAKKKKPAPAPKEKKEKPPPKKSPKEEPVPEESEESSGDESPQKKPKEAPKKGPKKGKTPEKPVQKKRNTPQVAPKKSPKSLGQSSGKQSPLKKLTKQQKEQNNEVSSSEVSVKKKKPAPKEKKEKPPPKMLPKEPPPKKPVEKKEKPKLEKKAEKMTNKQAFDDSDEGSLSSFLRSAKKSVQELVTETPPTRALNSVIMELSEVESSDEAATPVIKPKNKKWVARIAHMKEDKNLNDSQEGKKPNSKKRPAPVSKEVEKLVEAATSKQLRTPEPLKRGFENTQETVSEFDGYGSCDSS